MKTKFILFFIVIIACRYSNAQTDSLTINYYENYPYAYTAGGMLKGIEIDIIAEYVGWLKQKKNINVKVKYVPFSEFGVFYNSIKNAGPAVVGLGSVTYNVEREKEVSFSPPFLENIAVLITDGTVPTIKSKEGNSVAMALNGMSGLVVSKSNHVTYMNNIRKYYDQTPKEVSDLVINTTEIQNNVLDAIAKNKKIFGYVDIIAYWAYIKANPTKFLKIQKEFTASKEFLGFIMPKKNMHGANLSEFFESGFGFTSTKTYHQILEKYLGYEIIDAVEIK